MVAQVQALQVYRHAVLSTLFATGDFAGAGLFHPPQMVLPIFTNHKRMVMQPVPAADQHSSGTQQQRALPQALQHIF